eukprot:1962620-Amphidinium_carterae.2
MLPTVRRSTGYPPKHLHEEGGKCLEAFRCIVSKAPQSHWVMVAQSFKSLAIYTLGTCWRGHFTHAVLSD